MNSILSPLQKDTFSEEYLHCDRLSLIKLRFQRQPLHCGDLPVKGLENRNTVPPFCQYTKERQVKKKYFMKQGEICEIKSSVLKTQHGADFLDTNVCFGRL